jgi:hypothetical protein
MAFDKKLRGFLNTQDPTISNVLLENMVHFYDWGYIDKGAYFNVDTPSSGIYGGRKDILKRKKHEGYTDGQVFEAYRGNWVWETGVSGPPSPTRVSGVYINDAFYATGNTTYPFNVDYLHGRIFFDNAIPSTGTVEVEYSDKNVKWTTSDGIPWLRQIQKNSFRADNPTFSHFGSGDWNTQAEQRVQLPVVGVKVIGNTSITPYQLGGGQTSHNDVIFYIFTEKAWECQNIADTIVLQNDRNIDLFDSIAVGISGVYPLTERGFLNENALPSGLYPNMIDDFNFGKCFINNSHVQAFKEINPNLYHSTVRCTASVDLKNL